MECACSIGWLGSVAHEDCRDDGRSSRCLYDQPEGEGCGRVKGELDLIKRGDKTGIDTSGCFAALRSGDNLAFGASDQVSVSRSIVGAGEVFKFEGCVEPGKARGIVLWWLS